MIGELREDQFVAKTIGMISAAKENQKSLNFRFGMNNDTGTSGDIRDDQAVKFRAIAIHSGIDGIQNSYVHDRARGEQIERIQSGVTKPRLQMKCENHSRGNAKRFKNTRWNLSRSRRG